MAQENVEQNIAAKRISRIAVSNLFDMFDYDIPFNMDMRITIIHGLNGYGKTTLLKMIDGIFNADYTELRQIPFNSFIIYFDDGDILTIIKDIRIQKLQGREIRRPTLQFDYYDAVRNNTESYKNPDRLENRSNRERAEFERIGPSVWLHRPTGEALTNEEIINRYGDLSVIEREINIPEWLSKLRESLKIRFIQSQRLLLLPAQQEISTYRQKAQMTLAVTTYAKELSRAIESKLGEYAATSQSLDRTFPVRLVRQGDTVQLTAEQIRQMLSDLESRRARLINAGLLEKNTEEDFQIFDEINEQQKNILSVYIKDVNQKLDVLNDIADKIDLFKQIMNDHFNHKYISVDKDKGFAFFTINNKPLSPEDLSTGEQHQLILVYESLFKVEANSLILIDEPEISLHVEWQVQFLEDLQNIIGLSKFDVLIATHSPQIINDRWDLTVRLSERIS